MLREIAGRYQIQKKLGAGAWATVYEALDTGAIGRRVAIKVFRLPPPDEGSSAAEEHARFRQGARAAGRLSHPNVVPVFDYGEDAEVAWIVMEMVEGETLKALLDRGERLPAPAIVRLMGQILDALAYTHSRGVVHRDIKPANIMLTQDRVVKITDFGVARIENSSMTHVGTVLGSPAYMAPEQFRGDAVDQRADIWASGVILYQLLTGERPFEGGVTSVMQKALYVEPVQPSLTKAAVPAQFDAVVAKALAKRPGDRFPSAEGFSKALREAAAAAAAAEKPAGAAPSWPLPDDATTASAPPRLDHPPRPLAAVAQGARARLSGGRAQDRRLWVIAGGLGAGALAAGVVGIVFLGLAPGTPVRGRGAPEAAAGAEAPALAAAPPAALEPAAAGSPAAAPAEPAKSSSAADTPLLEMASALAAARPVPPPVAPSPLDGAPARFAPAKEPAVVPLPAALSVLPAMPPRPPAPSRQDLDAAAAAAAAAIDCGVVVPVAQASGATLTGVARRGEAEAAEAAFAARGIPAFATRLLIEPFDGPYCDVLSQVRGIASSAGAPQVTLDSPDPLPGGELLRFKVQTPGWPAHLHVAYLMVSGDVGNLFSTTSRQSPRSRIALGEPQWEATDPYGTDLLLVIASERPLFGGQRRRKMEKLDRFAADLAPALSAAQEKGGRVSAQVVAVRTVVPRQETP
jgi:serine/threonine-protein kinase